jgi:HPt (histidine-containing phosphotransfer) domain-containing protein
MPEKVPAQPNPQPQSETSRALAEIWRRNQPLVLDRLLILEHAAQAAQQDILHADLRADAASVAHKLAGSLGMFGFPEGTRLAREIETMLESRTEQAARLTELTAHLRQSLFPAAV